MWTIIKINQKKFSELKKTFQRKIGESTIFFSPKIKIQKKIKNKVIYKDINLLGNYVLCYNEKLSDNNNLINLKSTIGLEYFLNGFKNCQKQIINFIDRCKKYEQNGYLTQNFFEVNNCEDYKFLSGPFTKFLFKITEIKKNSYLINLNNIRVKCSKNILFLKAN